MGAVVLAVAVGLVGGGEDGLSERSASRWALRQEIVLSMSQMSGVQEEAQVDALTDSLAAGWALMAWAEAGQVRRLPDGKDAALPQPGGNDRVRQSFVGYRELICSKPWPCAEALAIEQFIAGYRDYGGNPTWEAHWIEDVLPCEGGPEWWRFGPYDNGYISPVQFHGGSWATAFAATGLSDPYDPFHVGANVAWWSNRVDPGGTGGWPVCWHRGGW